MLLPDRILRQRRQRGSCGRWHSGQESCRIVEARGLRKPRAQLAKQNSADDECNKSRCSKHGNHVLYCGLDTLPKRDA